MTVCAERSSENCNNMYMMARLVAGIKSRERAEGKTYISERTLAKIETGERQPKPDEVMAMVDAYRQPTLAINYCQHECPIGQRFSTKAEEKDLASAVLGIIKEYRDLKQVKGELIDIAADGVIDETEKQSFEKILHELDELGQAIKGLKLWALSQYKKPAQARVAEERVKYQKKKTAAL